MTAHHRDTDTIWLEGPVQGQRNLIEKHGLGGFVWRSDLFLQAVERGDYDRAIEEAQADDGGSTVLALAIEDVQAACDALRTRFDASERIDGIVSVPLVKSAAKQTWVAAAERLAEAIDRPNVAFGVLATNEGIAAVTDLVAAGFSTDLWGVISDDQLRQADEAYLEGVKRREERGLPMSVACTVELPIRPIDDAINAHLDVFANEQDPMPPSESEADKPWPGEGRSLRGEVASAYAKLCVERHQQWVKSGEMARLVALGAHPQRVRFSYLRNLDPPINYADSVRTPGVVLTTDAGSIDQIASADDDAPSHAELDEADSTLERLSAIHQDLGNALREAFDQQVADYANAWDDAARTVEARARTTNARR